MKKFLSVLLAAMMVTSTFVIAAPSAVTGFDTAKEGSDDSAAEADLSTSSFKAYSIRYFAFGNSYLKYNYSSEFHVDWWMRNSEGGINDPRGMAASKSENDYFHKIQEYVKANLEETAEVVFEAEAQSIAGPEKSWIYDGIPTKKDGEGKDVNDYSKYDYTKGATSVDSNEDLNAAIEKLKEYKPNVVTLQIGENTGLFASNDCRPITSWFYDKIVGKIREAAPDAIIVVFTPFEPGVIANGIKDAFEKSEYKNCKEANRVFLSDNSDMVIPTWMIGNANYPQYNNLKDQLGTTSNSLGIVDYRYNNKYLAYQQYKEYDRAMLEYKAEKGAFPTDFRGHPGDEGMAELGRRAATILTEQIPEYITPEIIEIPKGFKIFGAMGEQAEGTYVCDSKKLNGLEGFAFKIDEVTPDGFEGLNKLEHIVWSVDNEEIAEIGDYITAEDVEGGNEKDETYVDGIWLIPKHNGTATLTATHKYNKDVKAKVTIEVKGMAPHYTLTYDLAAADAENTPEQYAYAAGDYTFPAPTVRPTRPGYKFAGWSLTPGGKAVDSVYMGENTTVYAVWEFAHDWQFNKDGDTEGIQTTGMHGKTEDGYFIAETYNSGAGSISATNLRIPSDNYPTFKTRMSLSEVKSGDKMVLEVGTLEKETNYTFEALLSSTAMTEYTFDISGISGETIDFFKVGSSNDDIPANRITVDYATFVESKVAGDREFDNRTVSGVEVYNSGNYKYTFTSLTVNSGASIYFGTGNYYIGSITNNGTITAAPDANVVITSGTVDGYISIVIGTKTNSVRYAEVDGVEHKIAEAAGNTTYGMIVSNDVDRLLRIGDGTNTRYYYIDASEKTAKEIEGLKGFMHKTNAKYDFVKNNDGYGAKFESYVNTSAKEESTAYTITEYGYIVSIDELLGAQQLNFDLDPTKYAYGAAYTKGVSDKVGTSDDKTLKDAQKAFRAVIYGTPEKGYGKKLVVKTYTKLLINGQEFIVYGETQYESLYSLAKQLDEDNDIVKDIIGKTENNSNEPSLDFGDLLG